MNNLEDLIPAVKRAVAVPGTFAALFPETLDDDLLGALLDGMAEAQLDGFLSNHTYDDLGNVDPDMTRPQGALVVIWTATRMVTNQITNLKTHVRYDAKGLVFEEDQGASLLVERLKGLRERKNELIELARIGNMAKAFHMADLAYVNAIAEYDARDLDLGWGSTRVL